MDATIDHPTLADAVAITRLIRNCSALDANSHYAQLLLCHHFRDTCMIAKVGQDVAGFVSAYRPPNASEVIFVWQIAVADQFQGAGIASSLLDRLIALLLDQGVRYLEATITPSNLESQRLFSSFARRNGAPLSSHPLFSNELFAGAEQHEAEDLYRIGPLSPTTSK
jgi:L-2,4-diaminobutyric acid acetyltransferase